MKFIYLTILVLANLNSILSCEIFETRKRCECKAIYGMGVQASPNEARHLYTLPSFDDCGINLGCNKERDCMTKCISQVGKMFAVINLLKIF